MARVGTGRIWFDDTLTGVATPRPRRIRAPDSELVWSADARWLLSTGSGDTPVTLRNPFERLRPCRSDRHRADGGRPLQAAFSPDAKRVFVYDGVS